ncbi:MAG: peptidyl-prolyl cis-trans isomerase [Defluviitaleaceae bacterium]|nr:peptidyl-prolyl cis-trans isomerase [Defluviitaleaceae bacterium]
MIMQNFLKNAAFFAVVMSMLLFAACTKKPDEIIDDENFSENGTVISSATTALDQTVATVNGLDVPAGYVKFWKVEAINRLEEEGIFPGSQNYEKTVLEKAVRQCALSVIIAGYAAQNGIVFSAEDEEEMIAQKEDMMDYYGSEEAFLEDYGELGVQNLEHFEQLIRKFEMMEKVVDSIIESPMLSAEFAPFMEPEEEIEEELLAAKHILIIFSEEVEENRFSSEEEAADFARELLTRIQAGEDFDALMHEHSQDPGLSHYPDGYTFVEGVMSPEFEEATRNLQIGDVSELVVTEHGTHIVLRVEPNPDDVQRPWWGGGPPTPEQRMVSAIVKVFEQRAEDAILEFFPSLYEISVN